MGSLGKLIYFFIAVIAGGVIAVQSVLNASLGKRSGHLGSVLILTIVSLLVLIALIQIFPSKSNLKNLPRIDEWYLYFGGVLGVFILATPIILIPKIGTASTLIAFVLGQSLVALLIDNFGLFASPKLEISIYRIVGIVLIGLGAFFISKQPLSFIHRHKKLLISGTI